MNARARSHPRPERTRDARGVLTLRGRQQPKTVPARPGRYPRTLPHLLWRSLGETVRPPCRWPVDDLLQPRRRHPARRRSPGRAARRVGRTAPLPRPRAPQTMPHCPRRARHRRQGGPPDHRRRDQRLTPERGIASYTTPAGLTGSRPARCGCRTGRIPSQHEVVGTQIQRAAHPPHARPRPPRAGGLPG